MCGIAGLFEYKQRTGRALAAIAGQMTDCLLHRGPDAGDVWHDDECRIALGHRRLSIVDLSPAGAQPMVSRDGRFVIVYNGEIYNFQALRAELQQAGIPLRGHSDTEVLLEACARYGAEEVARRAAGIFAFALWDRRERTLTLVRDHLGVKPIYWSTLDGTFVFASELKSIRKGTSRQPAIDRNALATFLELNYVPAPWTIYEGIQKLSPGALLVVRADSEPSVRKYWDAKIAMTGATAAWTGIKDGAATDRLEVLLQEVVGEQMVADVHVGVFLSGGVDSSTIAAIAQAGSDRPIHTFAIGFDGTPQDETRFAREVAKHLGTRHEELHVDGDAALEVIPRLADLYDEPLADFAQLPTFLLSALARRHAAVALSGDGGDELFGGYQWYDYLPRLSRVLAALPHSLRSGAALPLAAVAKGLDAAGAISAREKVSRLVSFLDDPGCDPVRHAVAAKWTRRANPVRGGAPYATAYEDPELARLVPELFRRRQLIDLMLYLPDDLLAKVDRASMATSLEVRVPLLDQRIVQFASNLPLSLKVRGDKTKWLLRQVLYRHVPSALIDRPKMGFVPPMSDWLRGPLREWGEELLSERRLKEQGLLDARAVRKRWHEHQSGRMSWPHSLWGLLVFQSWYDRWNAATESKGSRHEG